MPEGPSTAKGNATSRRILDAAAEEFAQWGIAGARVERIVAAARTNKAQLYGYFGNKDGLFDAVVLDSVDRLTEGVPFDAEDLADWAVRLYDDYLVHPELVRLATWLRLERRPSGRLFEGADALKIAAITRAQEDGLVRAGDPFDVLVMVIAMSCAWSPVGNVQTATPQDPPSHHERRRTFLRESVERAVRP